MSRIQPGPLVWCASCLVFAVVGIIVYRTAHAATYSWFAYSPDPPTYESSSTPSAQQIVGLVLAAFGLAGASAAAGYLIGTARAGRPGRP